MPMICKRSRIPTSVISVYEVLAARRGIIMSLSQIGQRNPCLALHVKSWGEQHAKLVTVSATTAKRHEESAVWSCAVGDVLP